MMHARKSCVSLVTCMGRLSGCHIYFAEAVTLRMTHLGHVCCQENELDVVKDTFLGSVRSAEASHYVKAMSLSRPSQRVRSQGYNNSIPCTPPSLIVLHRNSSVAKYWFAFVCDEAIKLVV